MTALYSYTCDVHSTNTHHTFLAYLCSMLAKQKKSKCPQNSYSLRHTHTHKHGEQRRTLFMRLPSKMPSAIISMNNWWVDEMAYHANISVGFKIYCLFRVEKGSWRGVRSSAFIEIKCVLVDGTLVIFLYLKSCTYTHHRAIFTYTHVVVNDLCATCGFWWWVEVRFFCRLADGFLINQIEYKHMLGKIW